MNRYVPSTAAAVLLLATSAYAQEPPPLRAAVDGTFAPHAFPNLSGGYQGFNVDLANEIAKRLKRKVVIDAAQFSGLVPALQAGTYDFLAAPTTVTKERAESMLFTEGYLNTDFQFLIKKGSPKVEKLEDLKGKTVSVNKGSAYDSWARDLEGKIGWKVESFGTQTDAVQAVLVGRADANVAGNTVIAWAVKNNPQLELSFLHSTGLVWAAPLRKDSGELRKMLDVAVECTRNGSASRLPQVRLR
jgi:polar amino acid transport system substrate-binding protein